MDKSNADKFQDGSAGVLKGLFKGLAAAYAITCIVFILYALLLTYTDMNEAYISFVAIALTVCSCLVAGFDAARSAKKRGLLWGVAAGLLYAVILFIIAALSGKEISFSANRIILVMAAAAAGGMGGIIGINLRK